MKSGTRSFPIVGIGASAGGLEAFTNLLEHLPRKTGMAFVLVQHLDPTHKSKLAEVLSRATSMAVVEVRHGMRVQPEHVYIIPPNRSMVISGRVLRLRAGPVNHRLVLPIDTFLRSLAAQHRRLAIGVILSGTATDGIEGLKAIKAEGGVTFVQDPQTAKYDGMPNAAINTGCVDFVMSPAAIATELGQLDGHPHLHPSSSEPPRWAGHPEEVLNQIFGILRLQVGVDFAHYKPNTILRRIQRRMVTLKFHQVDEYMQYLKHQPTEVANLYEDLLISVTEFFRDSVAFQALKKRFFPGLLKGRTRGTPIRIWVPGCATGEEVYSLAIALLEFLGEKVGEFPIQIFGTDISERALAKARSGLYSSSVEKHVPAPLLRRYFIRGPVGYQISKSVRECCVFAVQNVTKDPPFSNLDLISCRNVMIYFGGLLQTQIMAIFHYALKPSGLLLLGASETIGEFSNLFTVVDKKAKIYARKYTATRPVFNFALNEARPELAGPAKRLTVPHGLEPNVQKDADRLLLSQYAPASVLVNEDLEIVQIRGHTGAYLEPASGAASLNLLKMAREDLFLDLRTALQQARKRGVTIRKEGLHVRTNGDWKTITVEVLPLKAADSGARHFLVVFEEVPRTGAAASVPPPVPLKKDAAGRQLARLKAELASNKNHLQSVIEDLEAANEELKATSEEMQSSNEELTTVNEELQTRNQELGRLNNDLSNLLASAQLSILMIGPDWRIRRATPMAEKVLHLLPADIGRALNDLRLPLETPALEPMINEALDTLSVKEREVRDRDGHWYLLQVRPYRTMDNKIDGAVLALLDIDALKRVLIAEQAARDYAETIVETVHEPLVVLDAELRILTINQAFCRMFRVTKQEIENRFLFALGDRQWNIPALRLLLEQILPKNTQIKGFCVDHDFPRLGHRTMMLNAQKLAGTDKLILLAIEDITDRLMLEMEIQKICETERQRIGHDLHDGLAQQLAAIHYMLCDVQKEMAGDSAAAAKQLKPICRAVRAAMDETRVLSRNLFPVELKNGGLAVGLHGLAVNTTKLFKRSCTFSCAHDIAIGDENRARQLYRIAQEAVTNAVKHTHGRLIQIKLEEDNGQITLTIRNDGRSFPTNRLKHKGMGLRIMQYRANIIGATLKIESVPNHGTTVTCTCCNPKT